MWREVAKRRMAAWRLRRLLWLCGNTVVALPTFCYPIRLHVIYYGLFGCLTFYVCVVVTFIYSYTCVRLSCCPFVAFTVVHVVTFTVRFFFYTVLRLRVCLLHTVTFTLVAVGHYYRVLPRLVTHTVVPHRALPRRTRWLVVTFTFHGLVATCRVWFLHFTPSTAARCYTTTFLVTVAFHTVVSCCWFVVYY